MPLRIFGPHPSDGIFFRTRGKQALVRSHCRVSFPGTHDSLLKKLGRCAEMIQKSVRKLASSARSDGTSVRSGSRESDAAQSEASDDVTVAALLSQSQTEELDHVSQDVRLSVTSLLNALKSALDDETTTSFLSRASSTGAQDQSPTRQSDPQRKKARRSLSLVGLNEVL